MRVRRMLILVAVLFLCVAARAEFTIDLSYAGPDLVVRPVTQPLEVRMGDDLSIRAVAVSSADVTEAQAITQSWTKVSGPGDVSFTAPTAAETKVSFSAPGSYVLSVSVTEESVSKIAEVQIIVSRRPAPGRYRGLLLQSEVPSGVLLAKVAAGGAITAVLQLGNQTYRFRPTLNVEGNWSGVVANGISSARVTLKTNPAGSVFNGVVKHGGLVNRGVLAKTGVPEDGIPSAANRGRHTFLLSRPGGVTANDTRGHGFGVVRVSSTAGVSIVGKTPDGLPFSGASVLRPNGVFDVYFPLFSPGDFLGGTLRFADDSGEKTDVSGTLVWRAIQSGAPGLLLEMAGSAFVHHPSYVEPWTGADSLSAQFTSGGQGRASASQSITIQSGGEAVMNSPAKLDLSLRVYRSGLFFGTFRIPGRRSKSDFAGAILQRTGIGGGMLMGSSTLGWVELKPGSSGGTAP